MVDFVVFNENCTLYSSFCAQSVQMDCKLQCTIDDYVVGTQFIQAESSREMYVENESERVDVFYTAGKTHCEKIQHYEQKKKQLKNTNAQSNRMPQYFNYVG